MSEENVEVVRSMFEDTRARNFSAALDAHTDDVVVCFHGELRALFGRVDGKAAVGEWMADWLREFGRDYRFEITELRDLGERVLVVVTHHGAGRSSGVPIAQQQTWIYTLRGSKIARSDVYPDRAAALQAVGLDEQENVEQRSIDTVQKHLVALNARDVEGYLAGCTDDIELWSLLSALEGPYVGAEGIRRFFGDVKDAGPDHLKTTVRIEAIGPDRVLTVDRWTASGRSSEVAQDEGIEIGTVYEFDGEKIKRIRVFADLREALDAAGVSE